VRAQLADARPAGTTDDARIASLVSLLHALKAVTKAVDSAQLAITKKELNANAKRIAESDWERKPSARRSTRCWPLSSSPRPARRPPRAAVDPIEKLGRFSLQPASKQGAIRDIATRSGTSIAELVELPTEVVNG
jgi:hypothetical protein